jgi:hypothetical protein
LKRAIKELETRYMTWNSYKYLKQFFVHHLIEEMALKPRIAFMHFALRQLRSTYLATTI